MRCNQITKILSTMPCSYCHNNTDHHAVSACPVNVQDRALHIFNESIDPDPHKLTTYLAGRIGNRYITDGSERNNIILSQNNEENRLWFKDSQGRNPNDEDWNLVNHPGSSIASEFRVYEIKNARYRRIVELLVLFRQLKFRPHLGHVTCSVMHKRRVVIPKTRRYKFGRDGILNYDEFSGEQATHYLNQYTSWIKSEQRERVRYIQRERVREANRLPRERFGRNPHQINLETEQHRQQQRHADYVAIQERAQEMRENGLPPSTQTQPTDNLPPVVDEPIESDCCAICMDPIGKVNCVTIRCGHQFCGDCIFHHLQMAKGTCCPLCRKEYAVRPKNYIPTQRHNVGELQRPRPRPRPIHRPMYRPQYVHNDHPPTSQSLHQHALEISTASGLSQEQFNTIVGIITSNN